MRTGKPVFELGAEYSRWEIQGLLGGPGGDYLPTVDGRVVCACVTRGFNPDAPAIILAGSGPRQIRSAHLFCDQKEPVPVFIKVRSNRWEYVGEYAVDHVSEDPEEIAQAEQRAGWKGVSLIMHLKEAKEER